MNFSTIHRANPCQVQKKPKRAGVYLVGTPEHCMLRHELSRFVVFQLGFVKTNRKIDKSSCTEGQDDSDNVGCCQIVLERLCIVVPALYYDGPS